MMRVSISSFLACSAGVFFLLTVSSPRHRFPPSTSEGAGFQAVALDEGAGPVELARSQTAASFVHHGAERLVQVGGAGARGGVAAEQADGFGDRRREGVDVAERPQLVDEAGGLGE